MNPNQRGGMLSLTTNITPELTAGPFPVTATQLTA